jgi:hypothetical protein
MSNKEITKTMKTLTIERLKNILSSRNYGENSILEIGDDFILKTSTKSVLEENQVNLSDCVFWFSGTFNEDALELAVNEANIVYKNNN